MKQADLKEKSSLFVIGKGIIVIVLVGISSLSFLLGFFVGKINRPPELNQPPDVITRQSMAEKNPVSSEQDVLPQQAEPLQPAGEVQTPQGVTQSEAVKPLKTVSEMQKTQPPAITTLPNEPQKTGVGTHSKEKQELKSTQETKKPDETQVRIKEKKYTIQVGAFKNEADADALKTKLDKKGYKTFLIKLKSKNNENLYKVTVGAFSIRQEAELLAMKMKKSEKLKTFVTLKTG